MKFPRRTMLLKGLTVFLLLLAMELFFISAAFALNEPYLVKNIAPSLIGSSPQYLTKAGRFLFFTADDTTHGAELWKSDGTAAGTVMVKDINPGSGGSSPEYLINCNGLLYFAADDGTHGIELWKSDGTAAGTVMVKDINPGSALSSPAYLAIVNGLLYFSAGEDTHFTELWKSDGTEAGTVMVKDIFAFGSSAPQNLADVNGVLYFVAKDNDSGYELWKSDGTAEGTVLVKDIRPGTGHSSPSFFTAFNGMLYFSANDGTSGTELWRSDGTAAGTVMVKDIDPGPGGSFPEYMTILNNVLYFQAYEPTNGEELWKSDGTAAGTVPVKDLYPGGSSTPSYLVNMRGALYFAADDGTNGVELWKSDGTAAGTVLVKDIYPGFLRSSNPASLVTVNGDLYFTANDGTTGTELWKSDGTSGGTVLVKDIFPGLGPSSTPTSPTTFTNVNGLLYFVATDNVAGTELWALNTNQPAKIGVFQEGYWYLDADQSWDWNGTPTDILGTFGIGLPSPVPVVGDWTGDGRTGIGIYSDGHWYLDMNNNRQWDGELTDVHGVFGIGLPNAVPVVGDWTGTGTTEVGIYANGAWYLDLNGNGAWDGTPTDGLYTFGIGLTGAVPVTGDWNGSGATKIGVYVDGTWYLDLNGSGAWDGTPADAQYAFGTGLTGAMPVAGDWSGSGTAKIGVFDSGTWYVDTNGNGAWDGTPTDGLYAFGTGLTVAAPMAGRW